MCTWHFLNFSFLLFLFTKVKKLPAQWLQQKRLRKKLASHTASLVEMQKVNTHKVLTISLKMPPDQSDNIYKAQLKRVGAKGDVLCVSLFARGPKLQIFTTVQKQDNPCTANNLFAAGSRYVWLDVLTRT